MRHHHRHQRNLLPSLLTSLGQVLDPKERPIRDLTPQQEEGKFLSGDPTAQSYVVRLPEDLECVDCSIRLVRQARSADSSCSCSCSCSCFL